MKLVLLVAALMIGGAAASCPNGCSGHGACSLYDLCTCYGNWEGNDCSGRVCPHTKAWVDVAIADNDAHNYASCGNKGACDGKSGQCKCYEQFEGKGCRRMACNNGCSGHGTCEYMEELATRAGCEWDAAAQARKTNCIHASISTTTAGNIKALTYAGWDAKKIQGCSCDPGWAGNDCSGRICPVGNDPLRHRNTADSSVQVSHVYKVDINTVSALGTAQVNGMSPGSIVLTFTDTYNEVWWTRPIALNHVGTSSTTANIATPTYNADLTTAGITTTVDTYVTNALLDLPNCAVTGLLMDRQTGTTLAASALAVTVSAPSATTMEIVIELNSPHNTGDLKNRLACYSAGCSDEGSEDDQNGSNPGGCSPRYNGLPAGATCTVTDTTSGTKNEDTCSGRGSCDGGSGLCKCFEGYTDEDCSMQTILL